MAQAAYEVSVRIERDTHADDDYGGSTAAEGTVASGVLATKHFHSSQRLNRFEGAAQGGGPGVQTVTEVFFKFQPPFPAIAVNDRIVEEVAGTEWTARFVRSYSRTMQVDAEVVA